MQKRNQKDFLAIFGKPKYKNRTKTILKDAQDVGNQNIKTENKMILKETSLKESLHLYFQKTKKINKIKDFFSRFVVPRKTSSSWPEEVDWSPIFLDYISNSLFLFYFRQAAYVRKEKKGLYIHIINYIE